MTEKKNGKEREMLTRISKEVIDSGVDVDEIKEEIAKIKEEVVDSGDDVDKIREDLKTIKEEVVDSGDDVDKIRNDLKHIKKEVVDSGGDVDEIKEDIDEIKTGIKTNRKLFRRIRGLTPDKFAFDDLAQQIVGATIVSAPFVVTEEVWRLASELDFVRVLLIILITITFDILLFYYTKYQKIKETTKIGPIILPVRIISLLGVTYVTSAIMLTIFGVLGGHVTSALWAAKLVVLVGLFANIGAGTADIIR